MQSVISKILEIFQMGLKGNLEALNNTSRAKFIPKTAIYCLKTA